MKLAPAAEFALRGSIVLAERYGNGPVTLDSICEARDLPKQYLVKIFAMLAKSGLLRPVRGKHGGYMLARAPEQISLLEIIEAVQGPIVLNYCQHDPPQCDNVGCPVSGLWADLQKTIRTKLASMTLDQCINNVTIG